LNLLFIKKKINVEIKERNLLSDEFELFFVGCIECGDAVIPKNKEYKDKYNNINSYL
jgi:hypothetical protein